MDPFGFCVRGFSTSPFSLFAPLFPFNFPKKKASYSWGYDSFYSSSVMNLTMKKKKGDPFGTRLTKS